MCGLIHIHQDITQRCAAVVVGTIHIAGDSNTRVGKVGLTDIHRSTANVNRVTTTTKHVVDCAGQQVDFTVTHDETCDGIISVTSLAKHTFASAIYRVSNRTTVDVDLSVVDQLHIIAVETNLSILAAAIHTVGKVGAIVDVDSGV